MRVKLSYEERIIDALANLPRVKDEHFIARGQREHAAIRAILQPLYAHSAERAEAIERCAYRECDHLADEHGTDQEVDADDAPTGLRYLVCFTCFAESDDASRYSHDYEPPREVRAEYAW